MDKLSHSSQLHGRGGLGLGSYQTELQVKVAHARGLAQPGAGTFQGSLTYHVPTMLCMKPSVTN